MLVPVFIHKAGSYTKVAEFKSGKNMKSTAWNYVKTLRRFHQSFALNLIKFLSPVTTGDIYGRIFPKKQGRKPTESKYENVYGSRNILHVI